MKIIFSNIVFKEAIILCLFQHLLISATSLPLPGPNQNYPFRHSLETDKAALLAFKRAITDPNSTTANWNESTPVCHFTGVSCDKRYLHRVVVLNLNDSGLVGILSPFISNLTQLRKLELVNNHFYGLIPSQLSSLRNLRDLRLDGNHLSGPIPASFSHLSKLILVIMSGNNLNGTIPPSIFSNCTSLQNVDLSENQLSGRIPPEIENCPSLWNLNLYTNQLTGEIPMSLSNVTSLINLDVEDNQLSGELPVAIVSRLPIINYLHLSNNKMTSQDKNTNLEPFFTALSNCTQLKELELASMGLGGSFPHSISTELHVLLLQENQIHGEIPFSLTNASELVYFNVEENHLSGELPVAVVSRLPNMIDLRLSYNNMMSLDSNTNLEPFLTALLNCTQFSRLDLEGMGLGGSLE